MIKCVHKELEPERRKESWRVFGNLYDGGTNIKYSRMSKNQKEEYML